MKGREGGEGSGGRMEGGRDVGKRREREGREERRYSTAQMQGIANAHVKHVCLRMQTRSLRVRTHLQCHFTWCFRNLTGIFVDKVMRL